MEEPLGGTVVATEETTWHDVIAIEVEKMVDERPDRFVAGAMMLELAYIVIAAARLLVGAGGYDDGMDDETGRDAPLVLEARGRSREGVRRRAAPRRAVSASCYDAALRYL